MIVNDGQVAMLPMVDGQAQGERVIKADYSTHWQVKWRIDV